MSRTGKHTRKEECTYHYGKGVKNKGEESQYTVKGTQNMTIILYLFVQVPGGVETRYSCCEGVMGSPGCQVFKVL